VVIAAITSCTNTSNPSVLIAAGLVARKAVPRASPVKPWVKTSLAPGSQVVTEYLDAAGLQKDLDALGFNLVGYGCTTCIGNSGPLPTRSPRRSTTTTWSSPRCSRATATSKAASTRTCGQLSRLAAAGRRLRAGRHDDDRPHQGAARHRQGRQAGLPEGHLADDKEIADDHRSAFVTPEMFRGATPTSSRATSNWQAHQAVPRRQTYAWDDKSTYVQNPPYFDGMGNDPGAGHRHRGARVLGLFGDSITTDHISPAGSIKAAPPAGKYLIDAQGVAPGGLQPVRHAPRQPRSHDARHLRQHPHQEPDGARASRAASPSTTRRRADADLRRGDALQPRACRWS
jgi:aconitate hydratase